jgi:hypothetical protein
MMPTNIVQKSCVGSGGGVGEETRLDGTCGGGRSPVVYEGQIERRKNKNRAFAMRFPGGGGQLFINIDMPLDPEFGFAMVVFFFEDWIPHDYYYYAENL